MVWLAVGVGTLVAAAGILLQWRQIGPARPRTATEKSQDSTPTT
ncbi:MAG: hypothetical protein RMK01_08845 [Thermomicrobium sp.]|nr:hypothetical protein [Thermomicrobium sp.]MDW8060167.1 hypothetical protein [Thermomicrobium sp.]